MVGLRVGPDDHPVLGVLGFVFGLQRLGQSPVPPALPGLFLGRRVEVHHHLVGGLVDDEDLAVGHDVVGVFHVLPPCGRFHVQPLESVFGQAAWPSEPLNLDPAGFGQRRRPAPLARLPAEVCQGQRTIGQVGGDKIPRGSHLRRRPRSDAGPLTPSLMMYIAFA